MCDINNSGRSKKVSEVSTSVMGKWWLVIVKRKATVVYH